MKELFGGKFRLFGNYRYSINVINKSKCLLLLFFISNYSCCQSDRQTFELPIRCFERNECTGLHWISDDPCSKKYRDSIEAKIRKEKEEIQEESENTDEETDYSI